LNWYTDTDCGPDIGVHFYARLREAQVPNDCQYHPLFYALQVFHRERFGIEPEEIAVRAAAVKQTLLAGSPGIDPAVDFAAWHGWNPDGERA
jgi:hypothetical protein